MASNKLAPRAYRARIVGYTSSFGTYWTIDNSGKQRLAKNPRAIRQHEEEESDEEDNNSTLEDQPEPQQSDITAGTPEEPYGELISPQKTDKRHRKTPADYTALYGTRKSERILRPSRKQSDNANPSVHTVGIDPDKPTYEQAMTSPQRTKWIEAIESEKAQLQAYGVYKVISAVPKGCRTIDTKWVLAVKRKADGSIEKYKARKVARGFTQQQTKHYDQTYAQMA